MAMAGGKEFIGRVVSNRMQKTVVVAIDHMHWEPKLKGYRKRTNKLKAHDEQQECNIGDTVRIHWCKRISKQKSYNVTEVLKRVPQFDAARAKELAEQAEAQQYSSRMEYEMARVEAAKARLAALREMYNKELGSASLSAPSS